MNLPDLDVYYRECVIGGPGAFLLAVDGFKDFADAVLQKLVLEVAESGPQIGEAPPLVLVQGGPFLPGPKYAPECDIGERLRMLYMSDARI